MKYLSMPKERSPSDTSVWVVQERGPYEGDTLAGWAFFDPAEAHQKAADMNRSDGEGRAVYVVEEIRVRGLHPTIKRLYDEIGHHTVKEWVKEQTKVE